MKYQHFRRSVESLLNKGKALITKVSNIYIEPENPFRMTYNVIVVFAFLYNAITVPYSCHCFEQYTIWFLFILDVIADIIFLVNLPLMLMSTTDKGTTRYRSRKRAFKKNIIVNRPLCYTL